LTILEILSNILWWNWNSLLGISQPHRLWNWFRSYNNFEAKDSTRRSNMFASFSPIHVCYISNWVL